MKKLFLAGALFMGLFVATNVQSYDAPVDQGGVTYDGGQQGAAPCDKPCDQPLNDCWCRYVHYEPCYYTTNRCIEEKIPCKKQCCRYVPKYYQVQRCRYVPQYYSETYCRQEPEYYEVDDCKTCQRTVCVTHCRYVPKYYWKHICGNTGCSAQTPAQPACPN